MIDIEQYITSGILESYCMGTASAAEAQQLEAYCLEYPKVKSALEQVQDAWLLHLSGFKKPTPKGSYEKIVAAIPKTPLQPLEPLSDKGQMNTFTPISRDSDYRHWVELTKDLIPPKDFYTHIHPLYHDKENGYQRE